MAEVLEDIENTCLCERFKTKGFDYGQKHPQKGVCEAGSRWTIPSVMARIALTKWEDLKK